MKIYRARIFKLIKALPFARSLACRLLGLHFLRFSHQSPFPEKAARRGSEAVGGWRRFSSRFADKSSKKREGKFGCFEEIIYDILVSRR